MTRRRPGVNGSLLSSMGTKPWVRLSEKGIPKVMLTGSKGLEGDMLRRAVGFVRGMVVKLALLIESRLCANDYSQFILRMDWTFNVGMLHINIRRQPAHRSSLGLLIAEAIPPHSSC